MSSSHKIERVLAVAVAFAMSGCLFGGNSNDGGGTQAHRQVQASKCFKDSGCALTCGSQGHYNQLNSKINSFLKGNPGKGIGDATALLPSQDSQCYVCGAPCFQAAVPTPVISPAPSASPSPLCQTTTQSLTIAGGTDMVGQATQACAANNAKLVQGSIQNVVTTPGPVPNLPGGGSTTFSFSCTCQ